MTPGTRNDQRRPDPLNLAGWLLIAALAGVATVLGLATLAAWATKED